LARAEMGGVSHRSLVLFSETIARQRKRRYVWRTDPSAMRRAD
jgi:hypothetical protein